MRTVALLLRATIAVAQTDKNKTGPKGKLLKGSEAVGAKLLNQKGKHIGEIDDVLFGENRGGMTLTDFLCRSLEERRNAWSRRFERMRQSFRR